MFALYPQMFVLFGQYNESASKRGLIITDQQVDKVNIEMVVSG
jgi:hypothetical protein